MHTRYSQSMISFGRSWRLSLRGRLLTTLFFLIRILSSQTGYSEGPDKSSFVDDACEFAAKSIGHFAEIALHAKRYDIGTNLLRMAIELNPGDAGSGYDPWHLEDEEGKSDPLGWIGIEQARANLESMFHGRAQVRRMITDRPAMAHFLKPTDNLWQWTAHKYSAKILNSEIDWDSTPPDDPRCGAMHFVPYNDLPGRICITNFPYDGPKGDKATAFEVLWYCAAFELHNIENSKKFNSLYRKARRGELDEEQFVKSCCALEFNAIQRTRRWYVEVFLPHLQKYNLPTNPKLWWCQWWGRSDEAFLLYSDKKSYPWVPYATYYEQLSAGRY